MRDEKIFARASVSSFFFLCCDIGGRKEGRKKGRENEEISGRMENSTRQVSSPSIGIGSRRQFVVSNVMNRVKRKKIRKNKK